MERYKHLMYCCWSASKAGEGAHPQAVMKKLGIQYQEGTAQSMADQWWFWNCRDIPEELPPYLEEIELNPMEMIGFGLSRESAEAIRDYSF